MAVFWPPEQHHRCSKGWVRVLRVWPHSRIPGPALERTHPHTARVRIAVGDPHLALREWSCQTPRWSRSGWHRPLPRDGGPRQFEQFGPSRQLVLEPAERASSADCDTELVHLVSDVDCGDEEFHVAIPRAGTLALDPQPPLLIVVDVSRFLGVLDRRLRPHLSGPQIDTPAAGG